MEPIVKIIFTLLLMLALMTTITFYIDNQSEKNIYNFCRSFAIGNSIAEVSDLANDKDFSLDSSEPNRFLVSKAATAPWSKNFVCEIIYQNDKITQLNFIIN